MLEVEKSERGVRGGQGKAKIAQKKGHLTPKRPKIADEGVLEPPKHPRNKYINDILYLLYYISYIIYYILYIIFSLYQKPGCRIYVKGIIEKIIEGS